MAHGRTAGKKPAEGKIIRSGKDKPLRVQIYKYRWLYLMYLPVFLVMLVFSYIPMAGIVIAFCDYTPFSKGLDFIGLENFEVLFRSSIFWQSVKNTLIISSVNIVLSLST